MNTLHAAFANGSALAHPHIILIQYKRKPEDSRPYEAVCDFRHTAGTNCRNYVPDAHSFVRAVVIAKNFTGDPWRHR